jgi:flagellar basal-body rod modification protein FlgD
MSVSAPEPVSSGMFATTAATGTSSTASGASAAPGAALPVDQLGKDTFLKLMVAQLRNQDPMNPTDSTQFLAQTAQFTSLEKMDELAQQSAQALSAQMSFGASGLVGKPVTYLAEDGTETQGSVSSVAFTSTGPMLHIGDVDVPLSSIVSVTA